MKSRIKAQGAMEYLMTYGWAILVVMLVGIVLWQMGIFSTSASRVSRATGDFGNQKVVDAAIMINSTHVVAKITNGEPAKITVSGNVVGTLSGGSQVTCASPAAGADIQQGDSYDLVCAHGVGGLTANEVVSFRVAYTYNYRVAGQARTRTVDGTLVGAIE